MNNKPTIENLEAWFKNNANKRHTYLRTEALRFCGLLIAAMQEIETLKQPGGEKP